MPLQGEPALILSLHADALAAISSLQCATQARQPKPDSDSLNIVAGAPCPKLKPGVL